MSNAYARRAVAVVALLMPALSAAPFRAQTPRPPAVRLVTREVSLGRDHPREIEYSHVVSPDGRRVAFAAEVEGGEAVFVDGVPGKPYTRFLRSSPTEAGVQKQIIFSPDSRRVAYVAMRDKKYVAIVDGAEGPELDGIEIGAPVFSADGKRVAYSARQGSAYVVVADGVVGKPYDYVTALTFSPDGRRLMYEAKRGERSFAVTNSTETPDPDRKGVPSFSPGAARELHTFNRGDKFFVSLDGVEYGPYDGLGNNIEFSDDGRRVLYLAHAGGKEFIVLDGVAGKKYEQIEENSYKLSSDGRRTAFVAKDFSRFGQKEFAVVDGKEGKPYDRVQGLSFGRGGRRVAYAGLTFGAGDVAQGVAVIDGVEGERFEIVGELFHFSPEGGRVAYVAERAGKKVLVADGKQFAYDEMVNIKFGPGTRLMFAARRGGRLVVYVDGAGEKEYAAGAAEPADNRYYDLHDDELAFSSDGRRAAYVANQGGREFVVVDGVEGQQYDDIDDLQFTADGRHVVFAARRGGKSLVVVDGVEGREYDSFVPVGSSEGSRLLSIEGNRQFGALARLGAELMRVEFEIVEK